MAQGHYQAQNFHQSHGQTENPETLNATGGSQYMHYTKILCHRWGGPDHMTRDCVAASPKSQRGAKFPFSREQKN